MFLRPIFICAAGVLALELLAVNAAPIRPVDPPKGWSVSDSIGTHYLLGYEPQEKAYFIENIGPIEATGKAVNAETAPYTGGQRVPYTNAGLKATDLWAASLLQSVKAMPFRNHKLRLQAEVKSPAGFKGQFYLMLRGAFPSGMTTTMTDDSRVSGNDWQTLTAELGLVPDDLTAQDDSSVTFGFLIQGEGRVLIRAVKLTSLEYKPDTDHPHGSYLQDMFSDPPVALEPVNVELRR